MFPRNYRLPGHRIPSLIKSGKRVHSVFATSIITPSIDNTDTSRITVIVPIRLSKKAVDRNRTKRLLREAIHTHLDTIKPGFDVIIMAKKLLLSQKLADIQSDIDTLLVSSKLI